MQQVMPLLLMSKLFIFLYFSLAMTIKSTRPDLLTDFETMDVLPIPNDPPSNFFKCMLN